MIFKSPHPDVFIPDVALTPFVLGKADRLGDKVAIVEAGSGRSYSYRQIADGVDRLAAGLHARGFRKGDVLAIMSPNLPEYPIAFHGVATAGGVNTTLNPTYTADEIALLIADPTPELCTGTEVMRAVVSGATIMQMPIPKITEPGRKSTR